MCADDNEAAYNATVCQTVIIAPHVMMKPMPVLAVPVVVCAPIMLQCADVPADAECSVKVLRLWLRRK